MSVLGLMESIFPKFCGMWVFAGGRNLAAWTRTVMGSLPHVSRTKGHSESTSLLGARPMSCAHCLVLAETARLCGTSAEGFEYHDPSGRSGLPSARMFWRLWCASQSPVKLGSKPRGMTSHTHSCCEFRVHSLDKSLQVSSRSERNERGTIRSGSPENGPICLHYRTLRVQRV